MSGGGGTTTSTQTSEPWAGQQPYLTNLYNQASALPLKEFFPDSTVIPQSDETLAALDLQTQRALYGSPLQSAGQDELTKTLSGDYLYGGAGFNAAFDAARNKITPAVQGGFERAGRFGGGLAQEAETSALGDSFASLYNQERGRQMAGLGMVPAMSGLDYRDLSALSEVGQQREAFSREQLADQMARHDFAQNAPYDRLAQQSAVIQGGFPGGTITSESPYYRNQLGGAIGGGMAGLGLAQGMGSMFPSLAGSSFLGPAGLGLGILAGLFQG